MLPTASVSLFLFPHLLHKDIQGLHIQKHNMPQVLSYSIPADFPESTVDTAFQQKMDRISNA